FESFRAGIANQRPDRVLIHPWPDGQQMSAVLTHDVETKAGLDKVFELADVEESLGFRSCWNLIPHKYPVDPGIVAELKWRGHEVGVHGYNHDGRLFESKGLFNSRKAPINDAIQRFGSGGFRAPMVHRNLLWLQELDIDYDASCFDVDPFQAMAGGVGSVWPFFAGKFVELPYTLPQDHTLMVALGQTSPQIWIDKFKWLSRMRGMAMLITHPDYLDTQKRMDTYRQYLEFLNEQREHCWMALPQEVVTWWRQRDGMEIVNDAGARVVGPASERASLTTLQDMYPKWTRRPTRMHLDSKC
ncbi:MAG: hypothetical protein AAGG44_14585, partial [Planctomycetota bacterium]